ncbi:beta-lactamase family protein [Aquibium sp. A9E412]|uniref:serine hydrolase domain-containing protein n=1 Tax=Aquibium sp. A9E412 TaxID=2976767 RepID=UPI0025B154E5|nr:serine hydrolase [Aquibium sp. A9E412]MDN2567463.1 beta-lactamase family protein [Aquibium sp. A9E412]
MTDDFSRRDVTLANWRTAPYCRWSFQHVEELVPVATIAPPAAAPAETAPPLADIAVPDGKGGRMPLAARLTAGHADSLVALKDGRLAGVWHAADTEGERPHLLFSVSKSVTGLLAGIAADERVLDPEAPVADYVPLDPASAYGSARVRHLLDMTVDLAFEEDYLDRGGAFDRYRRAMLWNPERADTRPETLLEVLASLERAGGRHGERFYYASPNTDMLGLVIEAATGRRLAELIAERLWRPMGATGAAWITVDRVGTARAAGGFAATARDLARLGQLVLDGGTAADGRRVVPAGWIDDMRRAGDRAAWTGSDFAALFADGAAYRACWYETGPGDAALCALGIHGQWLWIDPARRVVLALTAARPLPSEDTETIADRQLLEHLAAVL